MNSSSLGMIIELLVAGLLVMTICYCVVLNKRLKNLRADEQFLKTTIGELIHATEIAERAILGLKATTQDAEQKLGQKLRDAQFLHQELKQMTAPYGIGTQASIQQPQLQNYQQPLPQTPQPQPQLQPQRVLAHAPAQHMPPAQFSREPAPVPQRSAETYSTKGDQQRQPQDATRDFRVFTRSAFTSRQPGG